jgi:hypothetical protein
MKTIPLTVETKLVARRIVWLGLLGIGRRLSIIYWNANE